MEKCPQCKRDFPDHLITDMFVSTGRKEDTAGYIRTCPLCALRISNNLHGDNRTRFGGEIAQSMLEEAQDFVGKTV